MGRHIPAPNVESLSFYTTPASGSTPFARREQAATPHSQKLPGWPLFCIFSAAKADVH